MLPCSNRHTIVGNCLQSSQNSCAGLILPPTFQQLTSDRMLSRGGFKVRHGLCSANGCLSASAAGGSMAQSGSNVLVTCRSSVRRGRTAASPFCQLEVPTQCCRSALKKAIVQRASSAGGKKRSFLMVRCNPLLGRNCGKFQWGDVFITSERTCMHVSWLPSLMLRTSHDSESLYFTSEAC